MDFNSSFLKFNPFDLESVYTFFGLVGFYFGSIVFLPHINDDPVQLFFLIEEHGGLGEALAFFGCDDIDVILSILMADVPDGLLEGFVFDFVVVFFGEGGHVGIGIVEVAVEVALHVICQ